MTPAADTGLAGEGGLEVTTIQDKPLCVDLCGGLGGVAEGFLAAGYRVVRVRRG